MIVFAALQSEGLDPATVTEENLIAEIEKAVKDLNERQGFEPFLYLSGDSKCLPFFSTVDYAEIFCGEYSKQRNRVFPFQTLTVRGAVLASLLPGCNALVLNPRSSEEYVLSEADMKLLLEKWG